ncbi:MBL fold metallo-hydrolase [Roseburia sp. 499]|uniref:MBL fold metallo-hydrolase n=1 Tax=Roseburia sp. 499 TaxID=1261634 RepID=UPI00117A4F60|nr:MBL fold metallo-hydrolase [Roseburia sp. 499]WVK68660.1 MBL fold metallo-hydrolase [Roseburia sp. 499]
MKDKGKRLLAVVLSMLLLSGCIGQNQQQSTERTEDSAFTESKENLEVHFIDVGQGDATLIRQGEHAMLIDAGDNSKGTAVQAYLQMQNIEKLDYVIGTHPDSDHIGGLDVILYKFEWDTVMMPDVDKDTRTYEDVIKVIQDKNRQVTVPKAGETYSLGMAEFTIVCPQKNDYGDNSNNYSIGLRLEFGENHFLFTGDAEEEAEQDMLASGMDLSADVFKAAHHGSDTANTEDFLETVDPDAVVISCGVENSYGHPRAAVMNQLRQMGVEVYRTDEQGTIVVYSDGENIIWNCSASESWKAGEPTVSDAGQETSQLQEELQKEPGQEVDNAAYVLNTNTGKFHKPSCSSVEQISEKNREYTNKSREEMIEAGYEPCKRCNP